jgi:hypothetical protein
VNSGCKVTDMTTKIASSGPTAALRVRVASVNLLRTDKLRLKACESDPF